MLTKKKTAPFACCSNNHENPRPNKGQEHGVAPLIWLRFVATCSSVRAWQPLSKRQNSLPSNGQTLDNVGRGSKKTCFSSYSWIRISTTKPQCTLTRFPVRAQRCGAADRHNKQTCIKCLPTTTMKPLSCSSRSVGHMPLAPDTPVPGYTLQQGFKAPDAT